MDIIVYMMFLLITLEQVANIPIQRRRKLEPKFFPTPTNITVHRGELAVLKCHIKDLGPKIVVWRKQGDDSPITIGEDLFSQEDNMGIELQKLSEEETRYDLIIKDVGTEQSGTYLCQVTATKLYTHYVTLTVIDEPIKVKKRIQMTGTEYVNQDGRIHLRCNITGTSRAPDDVDWFFDGQRILTSLPLWRDRTQILRRTMGNMYISELIVERSTLDDDGTYVCRSSGNSDWNVDSFVVIVLSVDKTNVSRRDKANLSHSSGQEASSSSGVVFHHSNTFQLFFVICCAITALTSNCVTRFSMDDNSYIVRIKREHIFHR